MGGAGFETVDAWEVRLIIDLDRDRLGDSIGTFRTREEAEQAARRQSLMCSIKKVRVRKDHLDAMDLLKRINERNKPPWERNGGPGLL